MKPNKTLFRKCLGGSFNRDYIEFLGPYHKLQNKTRDVAARILSQYFRLKESLKDQKDDEVLYEVLWSRTSRKDMCDSLGMTQNSFQMALAKLKRGRFLLEDNRINPVFIPPLQPDQKRFMLCIVFDMTEPSSPANE